MTLAPIYGLAIDADGQDLPAALCAIDGSGRARIMPHNQSAPA